MGTSLSEHDGQARSCANYDRGINVESRIIRRPRLPAPQQPEGVSAGIRSPSAYALSRRKTEYRKPKQSQISNARNPKQGRSAVLKGPLLAFRFCHLYFWHLNLFRISIFDIRFSPPPHLTTSTSTSASGGNASTSPRRAAVTASSSSALNCSVTSCARVRTLFTSKRSSGLAYAHRTPHFSRDNENWGGLQSQVNAK